MMKIADIDVDKICVTKIDKKEVIVGGKPVNYYDIYLGYQSQPGAKPRAFFAEFPPMESYGIISKEYEDTKRGKYFKYTIAFNVDMKNEKHVVAWNKMEDINMKLRQLVDANRKDTPKMPVLVGFKPEVDDLGGKFKNITSAERDEVTGELKEDGNKSLWFKLINYTTKEGKVIKTAFIDLEGAEIEWELMEKVKIKACPLIKFTKMYLGDKIYPFVQMDSCVVISREERQKLGDAQKSTVEALNEENAALKQQLMEALAMARENKLAFAALKQQKTTSTSPPASPPKSASLKDFLTQTDNTGLPQIESMNSSSIKPKIPRIPTQFTTKQSDLSESDPQD